MIQRQSRSHHALARGDWVGRSLISVSVLILLALILRSFHLNFQDIWWDEGRNVFTASRPLDQIASAKELDIHPPLYFYLLHVWMTLAGQSEFAVRFLSLWFGVAAVPLAYHVGVYLSDRHAGKWAAFLVASSPFFVDEAQQTRMYTLVIFLSTLSIYLMLLAVDKAKIRWWVGYVLAAVGSFYVHYSFIYILAAQNIYIAFEFLKRLGGRRSDRSFLKCWIGSQLAIAVLYLPQLPNILRQLQIYGNPGMIPPSPWEYVSQIVVAFLLGQKVSQDNIPFLGVLIVLTLVLALSGIWRLSRVREFRRDPAIILIWLFVPLIAYYVVLLKSPQFTPRYIMVATLPFYLLLAMFLARLSRGSRVFAGAFLALLVAANALALKSMYFDPAFLNDDTRGLAQVISEKTTGDDVVFIDVPFPLGYYYHGAVPAEYLFVDLHTTADLLTEKAKGKKNLFYITWWKSDTDPRGYVPYLLGKYATLQGELDLRGYHVSWYELPQNPQFSLAVSPQPASAVFGTNLALTRFAFGGVMTLTTPNPEEHRVAESSKLWAALWWKLIEPVQDNYTVSVLMRDAQGGSAAQEDRRLLSDRHLGTRLWNLGEEAINVYLPEMEVGVQPGEYSLNVIVYDPVTGKRLDTGQGDTFTLGKMQVVP